MEIAENATLTIAVFWVLWQLLAIRNAAINGKGIFPAIIPSSILFGISIVLILFFHLSPFHLLWLSVICFFFGFLAILSPQVQALSMGFFAFLSMTGASQADRSEETISDRPIVSKISKLKGSKGEKRGFG